jgi:hypothetical protein
MTPNADLSLRLLHGEAVFGEVGAQRYRIDFAEGVLANWEGIIRSFKLLIMTDQEHINGQTIRTFKALIGAQERCLKTAQEVLAAFHCNSPDSVEDSVEEIQTPSDLGTAPSTLSLSVSSGHSSCSTPSGISLGQQPFIRSSCPSPELLQSLRLPVISERQSYSSQSYEPRSPESQDIAQLPLSYPILPSEQRPVRRGSLPTTTLHPSWPPFKEFAIYRVPPADVWIMDRTWHVDESPTHLSKAEARFSRQDFQAGLITLDAVLATSTKTPGFRKSLLKKRIPMGDFSQRINGYLLRSCALLAAGDPRQGLQSADTALRLAGEITLNERYSYMQSKSQLYRGLCLMELKRWGEASAAFTRAASIADWKGRVAELMIEAQKNLAIGRNERDTMERGRM